MTGGGPARPDPVTWAAEARQSGGGAPARGREDQRRCDWPAARRRPRRHGPSAGSEVTRAACADGDKAVAEAAVAAAACAGQIPDAESRVARPVIACRGAARVARAAAEKAAEKAAHGSKSALRWLSSSSAGRDKGICELQATPGRPCCCARRCPPFSALELGLAPLCQERGGGHRTRACEGLRGRGRLLRRVGEGRT